MVAHLRTVPLLMRTQKVCAEGSGVCAEGRGCAQTNGMGTHREPLRGAKRVRDGKRVRTPRASVHGRGETGIGMIGIKKTVFRS